MFAGCDYKPLAEPPQSVLRSAQNNHERLQALVVGNNQALQRQALLAEQAMIEDNQAAMIEDYQAAMIEINDDEIYNFYMSSYFIGLFSMLQSIFTALS